MKRILMMASLFWPQKNGGGPPVSIMNLVKAICNRYELHIISNNYEVNNDGPLEGVCEGKNELPFGKAYYLSRQARSFRSVVDLIEEIQPELIYQNSFYSYKDVFPVLWYKKKHPETQVIITPRGEFQEKSFCNGRFKKLVYLYALKCTGMLKDVSWQFAAQSECDYWKKVSRLQQETYIIPNLTGGGKVDSDRIKEKGCLNLCYVGRVHSHKNLLFALDVLANLSGRVSLDVYGSCEEQEYYDACLKKCQELPENICVNFKGTVDNEYICDVIGSYHGMFLPTKSEAYGNSLVEAMLSAVPIITSTGTPWTDVNDAEAGYAVPLYDTARFVEALETLLNMNQAEYDALAYRTQQYIRQKLHTDDAVQKYVEMFG